MLTVNNYTATFDINFIVFFESLTRKFYFNLWQICLPILLYHLTNCLHILTRIAKSFEIFVKLFEAWKPFEVQYFLKFLKIIFFEDYMRSTILKCDQLQFLQNYITIVAKYLIRLYFNYFNTPYYVFYTLFSEHAMQLQK